nr:(-)-isopiperitenol/(-)-carveol dehydrogenase, mitochondrial-like [Tanacetum cinerariifolium]
MNKIEGKVAIITGGASGIGEATARLFARHGARAVVIADVQDELGKNVSLSIGSKGCTYFHCDITDEAQVISLLNSTIAIYGQLDIMFSNAGIITSKQLGQYGIRVNCVSPYAVATALMSNMLEKDRTEVEKIYQPLSWLKDVVLKVEDVAEAVLFLACGESTSEGDDDTDGIL